MCQVDWSFLACSKARGGRGCGIHYCKKIKLSCSDGFDGFVAVVAQFGKTLLETNTGKKSRPRFKKNFKFYLKN
jgi:hypothetical protein